MTFRCNSPTKNVEDNICSDLNVIQIKVTRNFSNSRYCDKNFIYNNKEKIGKLKAEDLPSYYD